jgi:hypothetical protein
VSFISDPYGKNNARRKDHSRREEDPRRKEVPKATEDKIKGMIVGQQPSLLQE